MMACLNISISVAMFWALVGVASTTPPTQSTSTIRTPLSMCKKVNSCKCSFDDGTVIDLAPLARNDGQAFFANVQAKNGYTYYWNPCNPFSYPTGQATSVCGNVAACMRPPNATSNATYSLGTQITAAFTADQGGVHLSYGARLGNKNYAANIVLKCNQTVKTGILDGDTYAPYVTNTTNVYNLVLRSKYACASSPSSIKSSSVSTSNAPANVSTTPPMNQTHLINPSYRSGATSQRTLTFALLKLVMLISFAVHFE